MSLIAFLNAFSGDLNLGDLAHLETIPEADRYYHLTTPARGGTAPIHTIPVPAGRKFILISANVLKPGGTSTGNFRAYFDLRYGGTTFDRIWFDDSQNPKTRESTYSHFLVGNGASVLQIVRRSATENAEVVILGYYRDNADINPSGAVQNLTAVERSPDDIRLNWDAPLNTGGAPIVGYRIRRGDTLVNGQVTNFITIAENTGDADTEFDDTALADNTVYYYRVIPLTVIGEEIRAGIESSTVAARTDIDHPGPATDLAATPQTSTSIGLTWAAPSDTGGTSIRGYRIERAETQDQVWRNYNPATDILKDFETENGVTFPEFAELVADTGDASTSYTDDGLTPNTVYFYRIRAINAEQTSLIDSNIAGGFVEFTTPTNLRHTIASDGRSITILWDAPTDTGGRTIGGYHVERSLNNVTFATLDADTESTRTNYTDQIFGGVIYYYRVSAIAGGIEGPPSTSITVTVPPRPPSAPSSLAARAVTESRIGLTWQTPADNGGLPITGYDLDRSTNIGFPDGTGPEEIFDESADPAGVIDGVADVASTIIVPTESNFPIAAVIVDVNVTHTYRGDLSVILTAPDGQMFTLKAVDFTDRAENIVESYSGDLLNDLIGTQSIGPWRLNVRDEFGALDHGIFNSWRIRIVRAVEPLMTFDLGVVNEFLDSGLEPETQYFYRVRAKHNTENGDYSNITNATTPPSLFGNGHDGDLEIAENTETIIDEHREYENVTIGDNAILRINAAVIQARSFSTIGTGRVIVDMTGCAGGAGGLTQGGNGGSGGQGATPRTLAGVPNVGAAGSAGLLVPPQDALSCTSFENSNALASLFGEVEMFIETFTNRIRGGMGSDGTAAAMSGMGGMGGSGGLSRIGAGRFSDLRGGGGGAGGTGAQGAAGVMGGGKAALMLQTINGPVNVEALGIAGNDGNKGTAAPGNQGGSGQGSAFSSVQTTDGLPGTAASPDGTIGSQGSQGGIVYLLYETISALVRIEDNLKNDLNGYALDATSPAIATLAHSGQLDGSALYQLIGAYLGDTGFFKDYRIIRHVDDETVISFDYRLVTDGLIAPSLKIEIINPANDAVLFTQSFAENPGVTNSGDKTASINITDAINDAILTVESPPPADVGITAQHNLGDVRGGGGGGFIGHGLVVDGNAAFLLNRSGAAFYRYDYDADAHAISNRRLVANLHARHSLIEAIGKRGNFFFFPTSDSRSIWRYAYDPATNTLSGGVRLNVDDLPISGTARIESMEVLENRIIFNDGRTQQFVSLDYDEAAATADNYRTIGSIRTTPTETLLIVSLAVRGDKLYATANGDRNIYVFDFDLAANTISNRRIFGTVTIDPAQLIGMDIDADSIFVYDEHTLSIHELESVFDIVPIDTSPNLRVRFATASGLSTSAAPISRIFIGRVAIEIGATESGRIPEDAIDVTGGQGGRSGTAAGEAEQFLPDRVPDGADGYKFISRLADLAT